MKFQRLFYNASIDLKRLSRKRIVFGILLGLISAFTIYSFFYVVSEAFRTISLGLMNHDFYGFNDDSYILNTEDRNFCNIFFSGLSIILGNSIAILFIFSRPNKAINRRNPKRKRLLNDQVFVGFNFSYWFIKIGLAFGVFSMGFWDFEFLPYFKPIAYLLLIVLYLETWKNLALIIKKKRFIVRVVHFFVMLCLIFGLSRIHVVNYKAIDHAALYNNPIIDYPSSDFSSTYNYYYWEHDRGLELAFKLKLDENNTLDIYTEYREKISLNEVVKCIHIKRETLRESSKDRLRIRILADKDLNLKYIKMFEAELYSAGFYKIIYEVYNKELYETNFKSGTIKRILNESVLEFKEDFYKKSDTLFPSLLYPKPPMPPGLEKDFFNDSLHITIQKQIRFNTKLVQKEDLIDALKIYIKPKTAIVYKMDSKSNYQDYITLLTAHYKAVNQLREKEQIYFRKNKYDYSEAYRKEQTKLKLKYPIIIIDKMD